MRGRLSGWYRLWILLSIIYLFFVMAGTFALYDEIKPDLNYRKSIRYIEMTYYYINSTKIKEAITELKNVLSNKSADIFDQSKLSTHGITIQKKSNNLLFTIENFERDDHWELEYSEETDINIICESIKTVLEQETPDFQKIRNKTYADLSDKEIISKIEKKYSKDIDFRTIEEEFISEGNRSLIKTIFIIFCIWIIPVIGIYLLGLSIKWVISGFKKA